KNSLIKTMRVCLIFFSSIDQRLRELWIIDVVCENTQLDAFGITPNEKSVTRSLPQGAKLLAVRLFLTLGIKLVGYVSGVRIVVRHPMGPRTYSLKPSVYASVANQI